MTRSRKITFAKWLLIITVGILGLQSACVIPLSSPASQESLDPTKPVPLTTGQVTPDSDSLEYKNDEFGFTFLYPAGTLLAETPDKQSLLISFPIKPDSNVVEENVTVSVQPSTRCSNPLAEGWEPDQLNQQEIELNGLKFLRQNFTGVAAGTTSVLTAYTTARGEQCITFYFVLRTFDPGNLDPTSFPTPPTSIDWQQEVRVFEKIVSTFNWLK